MSFMTRSFILFVMTCAGTVQGNASIKQRLLKILEVRMNSIEQDIVTLNASFINREDQVKRSETRIKQGLMDEKKWVRQKVKHVENKIHEVLNQVQEDNKDAIAEAGKKVQVMQNERDRKLYVAIAEVVANFIDEIRKRDVKIDEQQVEIDDLKQTVKRMKEVLNRSCPAGWTNFQSFCYLYIKERKNYDSARNTCLKLEASVADIESQFENDFVYKLCKDNGHTWNGVRNNFLLIGFSDQETEGVWISDRTRETSVYMNWRFGQPDSSTHHCIMMGYTTPYGKWNDFPCDDRYTFKFVCKKKLPYKKII